MKTRKNIFLPLIFIVSIFLAFGFSNLIIFDKFWVDGKSHPSLLLVSLSVTLISFYVTKQYTISAVTQVPQLLYKSVEFFSVFIFLVLCYWFIVNSPDYKKEGIILFFIFAFLLNLMFNKLFINALRELTITSEKLNCIVLGRSEFVNQFSQSIKKNKWLGLNLLEIKQEEVLDHLKKYVVEKNIKKIFIDWDSFSFTKEHEKLLRELSESELIICYAFSSIFSSKLTLRTYDLIGEFPYVKIFNYPLDNYWTALIKRGFDITFSILFIIFIASWLFPILAISVVIDSGFPIFFSQKRHGMNNKVFDCLKFRTMVVNKDSNTKITVRNDPRVTSLGRILRKTSIDELPQFINVLRGEMSVVGPRPHMVNQNYHYNKIISAYNFRHYVKPGITGLAQVSGYRGEVTKNEDMEKRVQSDLYYIRNWSFSLDFSIIYRTVLNMIKGDKNAI